MAKLSTSTNTTLHPRECLTVIGNLGSLAAETLLNADGASCFSLDVRGTSVLTLEVDGTVDGANWNLIPLRPVNQASVAYQANVPSTPGTYVGRCAGFKSIKVRCIAYTSGSATTVLLADVAVIDDVLVDRSAPLLQTLTAAAGVAVTLTLPAAGVGLRHYIASIVIVRFAAAALTAAAVPVVVTTTNLNSLAFSMPADAALQGTMDRSIEDFNFPLVSQAQNTATTIAAPLTANVIWRLTSTYYVAP